MRFGGGLLRAGSSKPQSLCETLVPLSWWIPPGFLSSGNGGTRGESSFNAPVKVLPAWSLAVDCASFMACPDAACKASGAWDLEARWTLFVSHPRRGGSAQSALVDCCGLGPEPV